MPCQARRGPAQNMANVDTPGYRAQHLPSFTELATGTAGAGELMTPLRASRPGHLYGAGADVLQVRAEVERRDPAPDGNTSSVEREMLESVNAAREHDRAISIYKSALTVLHATLARS